MIMKSNMTCKRKYKIWRLLFRPFNKSPGTKKKDAISKAFFWFTNPNYVLHDLEILFINLWFAEISYQYISFPSRRVENLKSYLCATFSRLIKWPDWIITYMLPIWYYFIVRIHLANFRIHFNQNYSIQ